MGLVFWRVGVCCLGDDFFELFDEVFVLFCTEFPEGWVGDVEVYDFADFKGGDAAAGCEHFFEFWHEGWAVFDVFLVECVDEELSVGMGSCRI